MLLTLAVSVAALLLLARFRFPERPLADLTAPQPLSRLTRVTAFDELSALLGDLLRQFEGAVVLVKAGGAGGAAGVAGGGAAGGAGDAVGGDRGRGGESGIGQWDGRKLNVLGLLVRDDLALVPLPMNARVEQVAGTAFPANGIVARDDERGLTVVRVPGYSAPELALQAPSNPLDVPGYVAILEATPDGPTIRAEFVSRYRTETDARWDQPVLAIGGGPLRMQPGALLFTLNGRFIGMSLDAPSDEPSQAMAGRTLIVPAYGLMARATRLAAGESVRTIDVGIRVQPLTPAVARATGAGAAAIAAAARAAGAAASGTGATGTTPTAGAGGSNGSAGSARSTGRSANQAAASSVGAGGGGSSTAPGAVAGVVVNAVEPMAGAREGAGGDVEVGDVIVAIGGQPVRSSREWRDALRAARPGATLRLSIVRFGQAMQTSIVVPPQQGASAATATGGATGATGGSAGAGGATAAGTTGGSTAAGGATGGSAGGRGATGNPTGTDATRGGSASGQAATSSAGSQGAAPAASRAPASPNGSGAARDSLGLTLRNRPAGGVDVLAVHADSAAERAGLRPGDIIESLPGRSATSADGSAADRATGDATGRTAVRTTGAASGAETVTQNRAATAAALASAYAALAPREALLIAVERQGVTFVTALEKP